MTRRQKLTRRFRLEIILKRQKEARYHNALMASILKYRESLTDNVVINADLLKAFK